MKIFADRVDADAYSRLLQNTHPELELVCLERRESGVTDTLAGLDDALAAATDGRPVVMVSSREHYEDPRWHAALGHPNVAFRRHPASREAIIEAFEEAVSKKRPADPLAIHVWRVRRQDQSLLTLRYELYSARKAGDDAVRRWESEARRILGDLPSEDLVARVTASRVPGRAALFDEIVFPSEEYPDVCVDFLRTLCEGTSVREEVRALVEARSRTRPITIWTGGDLRYAEGILRQNGIPWKIIPRPVTSEINVAVIIDDLPEEDFRMQQPLVRFGEYIQV